VLQAQKVTASHVRGAPPIIHKGWTQANFLKAKAEFEKKDPNTAGNWGHSLATGECQQECNNPGDNTGD